MRSTCICVYGYPVRVPVGLHPDTDVYIYVYMLYRGFTTAFNVYISCGVIPVGLCLDSAIYTEHVYYIWEFVDNFIMLVH